MKGPLSALRATEGVRRDHGGTGRLRCGTYVLRTLGPTEDREQEDPSPVFQSCLETPLAYSQGFLFSNLCGFLLV